MHDTIWRKAQVLDTIGMSQSWLYDAIAKGGFPAPIKLGVRAVGWRRSDVLAWLDQRASASLVGRG